jgi:hypothetical protein
MSGSLLTAFAVVVLFGPLAGAQRSAGKAQLQDQFDTSRSVTFRGPWAGTGTYTGAHGPQIYLLVDVTDAAGKSDRWAGEIGRTVSFNRAEELTITGFLPRIDVQPAAVIPFGAVPMLLRIATARHLVRVTGVTRADGRTLANVQKP